MRELVFVTRSEPKILEAQRILGLDLQQQSLDLPEVQAVELDLIVRQKAEDAYRKLGGRPVLVEDSGLFFDAWNGLPGGLVRWFEETVGCGGICKMLEGFDVREATARTVFAVHDGDCRCFVGEIRGSIAPHPRGRSGFGWDTIFIPDGETRTFAEMDPVEKDRVSMRRKALEALAADLKQESE